MKRALFPILALILALGWVPLMTTPVLAAASIWTDKADYAPWETVIISGSEFNPSTTVTVNITDPYGVPDTVSPSPVTDGAGNFTASYKLNGISGTYTVTATDGTNTAITTFTEKPLYIATITPVSASPSENKTYNITITNHPSNSAGHKMGSASVVIPTNFTSVTIISVTASLGKSWNGTVDPGQILLQAIVPPNTNRLSPGQSVSVIFNATAPITPGTYNWTTGAWVNPDWVGDYYELSGAQPTTVVTGAGTAAVTFYQSGACPAFAGTVVTVDAIGYGCAELPKTFIWNISTNHTFAYASPLVVNGKRYLWNSTTGLSTLQSGTITVPGGGGNVTGNYKTQYRLTMATNFGTTSPSAGDHWYDAGTVLTISATPPGGGYIWNGWTGTGTISYTGLDNPATNAVTMNSPITETASFTPPPSPAVGGTIVPIDRLGLATPLAMPWLIALVVIAAAAAASLAIWSRKRGAQRPSGSLPGEGKASRY